MKILYLVHTFYPQTHSGTEKFILNLSTAMQTLGHEVKIITYSFYEDSFYDEIKDNVMIKEFKYKDVPVIAIKLKNEDSLIKYDLEVSLLDEAAKHILKNEKPDIIHVGHPMRMGAFIKASKKFKIPYIATLTDFYFMCPKIILLDSSYNICTGPDRGRKCDNLCPDIIFSTKDRFKIAEDILLNAKKLIAPSNFVKTIFKKEFNNISVRVINHGIDYSKTKKNNKTYKKGDKITFGYAGALIYHKGVHLIIRAWKEINSKNKSLKIYGTGEKELLCLSIIKNKLKDIELCGIFTEDKVGDIFSNIDVMIVPSIWNETYCLVVYEALACNVPVIVSDIGALTEKIKNGINGFTFDCGNYEQLSKIIEMITENPEILNSLKRNIYNSTVQTLGKEAQEYEKIYYNCIYEEFENNDSINNNIISKEGQNSIKITTKDISAGIYYMDSNERPQISEDEWSSFLEYIKDKLKINEKLLLNFRYKFDYLKSLPRTEKVRYIIWGASNSGKVTKILVDYLLPNFELIGYIDKFKEGYFQEVKIYKPDDLKKLKAKYVFISTTPGKFEVEEILVGMGLKIVQDYMYGYGVI
ncbi:MAG: hypothetical protein JG777_859 [Clostridia bacterium]|jgi:glycosyltransferase involved in cell wall biosynthesis|nr:hypothetical protein [Clostridia bacterium]